MNYFLFVYCRYRIAILINSNSNNNREENLHSRVKVRRIREQRRQANNKLLENISFSLFIYAVRLLGENESQWCIYIEQLAQCLLMLFMHLNKLKIRSESTPNHQSSQASQPASHLPPVQINKSACCCCCFRGDCAAVRKMKFIINNGIETDRSIYCKIFTKGSSFLCSTDSNFCCKTSILIFISLLNFLFCFAKLTLESNSSINFHTAHIF